MATGSSAGVLTHLSLLEVQARSRRNVPQQRSRVTELKAELEALRSQREELKTEIHIQQTLERLRTTRDEQSSPQEEEDMEEDSENSELLKLMARHSQLKDLLLAHHLIGGFDIIKTRRGKGVCVSVATAYEGVCLDTYNLEMDLRPTLRISRHNVPPFIPLSSLAEEFQLQTDMQAFLDALSRHLNGFAGRKQQLKLVKEQNKSVEVMESNALCSILVLMFTVPGPEKTAVLCTMDYTDHTRALPTRVQFECGVKEILASPEWKGNINALMETPLHKALPTMRSSTALTRLHQVLQPGRFLLGNNKQTTCRKCCSSLAGMMRAVCVDVPGGPENLLLRSVNRPRPRDGEVLIKVHAAAMNRADLLQRRGLYPPPPGASDIIGLEAAGTVDTLGPGLKGGWRPEDRVMALLSGGGYAEYVAVPEEVLMPVPPNLTLCQAAAIPEAWLTAFQLLALIAQVKEGEVVLVHAGASGVGTAAVQLVRLFGAVPIVTAGSSEKLRMAEGLGAAAGFNYKTEKFALGVHDFTGGRGADVILDCIGGCNWEQNVSCLATDGRWVLYGTMGGRTVEGELLGKLLAKRGHLLSSLLRSRSLQYKADLVEALTRRVLPHFSQHTAPLRPVIDSTFNLDDIADAHRHMEANKNMGKIIINVIPQGKET